MTIISIKDYAKQKNVTYEAVRQQVARYRSELADHIIQDGRQQFLDDEAVAFLDAKRSKNPIVIMNDDVKTELEEAKAFAEHMKLECAKKDGQIELLQQQMIANAGAVALLEAAEGREKVLIEKNEQLTRDNTLLISKKLDVELELVRAKEQAETAEQIAEANEQEAERAKAEAEGLKQELADVRKLSIFQFLKYRRSKK